MADVVPAAQPEKLLGLEPGEAEQPLDEPWAFFGTPARAIGIQALLACVLVALGRFDQVLAYFIFITVVFLGLTAAALFAAFAAFAPFTRGPDATFVSGRRISAAIALAAASAAAT